jgi:luciferase family oxidoreductase group 1
MSTPQRGNHADVSVPLSLLDLAIVGREETEHQALANSVTLAQEAERLGFRRVWYAEHHNMSAVASSAPAVLIAHVAAHTRHIRLGSGGVMLPNHAPLTIAEQFGMLATLHPGRIDLGVGRAPGTDQVTMRALRRDHRAADTFPQDVLELQGYLNGTSTVAGVAAVPGAGTRVPLYILGSSLFGAQLAAALGLPFGFASHFAPTQLLDAVDIYRREFQPSAHLAAPHVIAALNVIAADTDDDAQQQFEQVKRWRLERFLAGGRSLDDDEYLVYLNSPAGRQVLAMMHYQAVGTGPEVVSRLEAFAEHARADEVMVAASSPRLEQRLHTLRLVAAACDLPPLEADTLVP